MTNKQLESLNKFFTLIVVLLLSSCAHTWDRTRDETNWICLDMKPDSTCERVDCKTHQCKEGQRIMKAYYSGFMYFYTPQNEIYDFRKCEDTALNKECDEKKCKLIIYNPFIHTIVPKEQP